MEQLILSIYTIGIFIGIIILRIDYLEHKNNMYYTYYYEDPIPWAVIVFWPFFWGLYIIFLIGKYLFKGIFYILDKPLKWYINKYK
jgi:hypothetical protein